MSSCGNDMAVASKIQHGTCGNLHIPKEACTKGDGLPDKTQ